MTIHTGVPVNAPENYRKKQTLVNVRKFSSRSKFYFLKILREKVIPKLSCFATRLNGQFDSHVCYVLN